jgi:hypothetical protein
MGCNLQAFNNIQQLSKPILLTPFIVDYTLLTSVATWWQKLAADLP